MKYLVMECNLSYAVVLDEEGVFRKAANLNYEVGQTVSKIVEMQIPAQPHKRSWLRPLAAMAACLVLVFTGYFFQYMPFASVYISINPQVRIDISRTDRVVGVEGVNQDGMTLLEGYDHRHRQLDLVMDELVDRAIDMGYLHAGGTVTVTLDAETSWVDAHKDSLTHHLSDHLSAGYSVTVDIGTPDTAPTPAPTSPGESFQIPAYHESDYAEAPVPSQEEASSTGGYGDPITDYDAPSGDDHSDYDTPSDDAKTNYDADSGYDGDGITDYGSHTPYQAPSHSDYDQPDHDSGYGEDHGSDYDDEDD